MQNQNTNQIINEIIGHITDNKYKFEDIINYVRSNELINNFISKNNIDISNILQEKIIDNAINAVYNSIQVIIKMFMLTIIFYTLGQYTSIKYDINYFYCLVPILIILGTPAVFRLGSVINNLFKTNQRIIFFMYAVVTFVCYYLGLISGTILKSFACQ